jgi:hypothetical protein
MTLEARKYRIIEQIVAIQNEQLLSRLEAFMESAQKEGTLLDIELSEKDKRLSARRKLAELTAEFPQLDISEEEILNEAEEARTARFALHLVPPRGTSTQARRALHPQLSSKTS